MDANPPLSLFVSYLFLPGLAQTFGRTTCEINKSRAVFKSRKSGGNCFGRCTFASFACFTHVLCCQVSSREQKMPLQRLGRSLDLSFSRHPEPWLRDTRHALQAKAVTVFVCVMPDTRLCTKSDHSGHRQRPHCIQAICCDAH